MNRPISPPLTDDAEVCHQRPSIEVMFNSIAESVGAKALGILLTGMGTDGAEGMLAIKNVGGKTVAQNQDSCIVFGMPGAAIARGAVDHVVHGDDLSAVLIRLAKGESVPKRVVTKETTFTPAEAAKALPTRKY